MPHTIPISWMSALALSAAVLLCGCSSHKPEPNVVAEFLTNADRQYETEDQRAEIIRAFDDMLQKPPAELRQQRYADYTGNRRAWPVTTLLERYFVPNPLRSLDPATFYSDVAQPEARAAIRRHLSALRKENAAH